MPLRGNTKGPWGFTKGNKLATVNQGTKKKKTIEWEQFGKQLLGVGLERAREIMERSTDKEFMLYYLQLLEYFKPKMTRVESNVAGQLKLIIERKISESGIENDNI